jgi:hypothetical protein
MNHPLTALPPSFLAQSDLLAPLTGDINFMIVVAVILISAFLIFALLRNSRKRD